MRTFLLASAINFNYFLKKHFSIVSIIMMLLIHFSHEMISQYDVAIEELMQRYMESVEENDDVDLNQIRDKFEYRLNNPVNLNKCEQEELEDLEILSDQQIKSFIDYKAKLGNLFSIYELQVIPLFDISTLNTLLPLVTVGGYENDYHTSLLKMVNGSKRSLFIKTKTVLEEKSGYISDETGSSKYAGDKFNYYSRFKMKYENRLDIMLIAEKDPGELFFKGYNKNGFDYYSSHIYLYKYRNWLKELNVGDYTISLGQGLILHNDFSRGKSALVTKLKKNVSRVIRPYSSVNENLYFRGLATTFVIKKNIEFSIFGSYKQIDASLSEYDEELESQSVFASTLQISGFHRLESEINGKHSINEITFGGRVNYKLLNGYVGINVLKLYHDKPLLRQEKLYNKFKFSGNTLFNVSADFSYLYKRIMIFGEIARSENNSLALLQGLQYVPSSRLDIALLYRNYSKSYESINSNSFAESVGTNNESGLYLGINLHLNSQWSLSAYHDIWKFPWFRYNISSPSFGNELFLLLKYKKRRKYNFYIQFKHENKYRDESEQFDIKKSYYGIKTRLRFHQNFILNKRWKLRNRVEFSTYKLNVTNSKGILIYQDIVFKPIEFPLSFTFRYALFDTDDYYSAIYAFENDILGESLIPAYFRKGFRSYMNIRYKPNTKITAEMRLARWYFPDEASLGSGAEFINSNHKTDLKLQLKLNF